MNWHWFFNGTMQARHLAAAYLVVWVAQGGYAAWIAWQWKTLSAEEQRSSSAGREPGR
jgi:hypothetical protein